MSAIISSSTIQTITHSRLHYVVMRHLVDHGHAPSIAKLSEIFEVSKEELASALRNLQAYHGVVLHPHNDEIWVMHPFSTAPTNFWVKCERKGCWWGNCAWCSLGVAALIRADLRNTAAAANPESICGSCDESRKPLSAAITITTTLGAEGTPVTVTIDEEGSLEPSNLLVHFPIPMTAAWDNVIYTCSNMLLFESEADIDDWCRRHAIPKGSVQPIRKIWEFAQEWYGHHLDLDWKKWTTEQAVELFRSYGLVDPVWHIPVSAGRF